MSKIQVGYDVRSKQTATKITTKLKAVAKKEGRLGSYEVEKVGDDWRAFHVLTEQEQAVMEAKCSLEGHKLHTAGYCVVCHKQVEESRG